MPVTASILAVLALLASAASEDRPAVDDDYNPHIIHEFDADYFERSAVNVGDVVKPKPDAVYTVEYVATKEDLDAEREFTEKYGISIDYLRKVQQRATQGSVGRIEAEGSDSPSKSMAEGPSKDSENAAYEPAASPQATLEGTKERDCDPPNAVPEPLRPWKSPTRVKAASRPDNGVALVVLVVMTEAVVLTAFIVVMWCCYSCVL